MASTAPILAATTVNYKTNDTCSWKILPSESELTFARFVNITINRILYVECFIYYGTSIDSMTNQINCSGSNSSSYGVNQIPSSNHIIIIALGKNDNAYLELTYQLQNYLDLTTIYASLIVGFIVLVCCAGCFQLVVLMRTANANVQRSFRKLMNAGTYISVELSKA